MDLPESIVERLNVLFSVPGRPVNVEFLLGDYLKYLHTNRTFSGFYYVPASMTLLIPVNQQSVMYQMVTVDGVVDIEGELVILE